MKIPQIRLESTQAKIKLNTTPSAQEIQQPKADLSIEQPKATLTIETTKGKFDINQTQAWEDMDLKHISKRIEEAADIGYQDWLEGIARRAQEGDQLMRIENGGDPIADLAKYNSESPIYEFNIGWIPSHGSVKLNYTPAKVNINVSVNKPIINSNVNKPTVNYKPAKVSIELAQKNTLKIDFDNLRFVGINYEQEI